MWYPSLRPYDLLETQIGRLWWTAMADTCHCLERQIRGEPVSLQPVTARWIAVSDRFRSCILPVTITNV